MRKSRAVANARAFLEVPFELVVDITGIKPVQDWHLWEDSEGNYLRINQNRHAQVYLAKKLKTTTIDIFRKTSPELIAKHSYWIICWFSGNKTVLAFLGNDGLLRSIYFENNKWQYNFSSLLLGYQALKYIISGYLDSTTRKIKNIDISYPKNLEVEESWISGYPEIHQKKLKEKIQCHLTNPGLVE